jgi:uncharacterized BrkB/YihY/UPF0761 family membrane protein
MVDSRHRVQFVSLIILLVTSSGVFLPLEVALNRIWRFENNRSYLGNQAISLGLAFACGVLALLSIALTAGPVAFMEFLLRGYGTGFVRMVGFVMMKVFALAASTRSSSDLLAAAQRSAGAGLCCPLSLWDCFES